VRAEVMSALSADEVNHQRLGPPPGAAYRWSRGALHKGRPDEDPRNISASDYPPAQTTRSVIGVTRVSGSYGGHEPRRHPAAQSVDLVPSGPKSPLRGRGGDAVREVPGGGVRLSTGMVQPVVSRLTSGVPARPALDHPDPPLTTIKAKGAQPSPQARSRATREQRA
jgi:hypothetical protein